MSVFAWFSTVDDMSLASEDAATEPHKDLQSLRPGLALVHRVRGQGSAAETFELRSVSAGLARFLGETSGRPRRVESFSGLTLYSQIWRRWFQKKS
jgi:hypothetical protein